MYDKCATIYLSRIRQQMQRTIEIYGTNEWIEKKKNCRKKCANTNSLAAKISKHIASVELWVFLVCCGFQFCRHNQNAANNFNAKNNNHQKRKINNKLIDWLEKGNRKEYTERRQYWHPKSETDKRMKITEYNSWNNSASLFLSCVHVISDKFVWKIVEYLRTACGRPDIDWRTHFSHLVVRVSEEAELKYLELCCVRFLLLLLV